MPPNWARATASKWSIRTCSADHPGGIHEGRAIGTHTGPLRGPAGEIPPTGKKAMLNFCGVYEFEEGKITSFHLYFDQLEMLSQPGITQGG